MITKCIDLTEAEQKEHQKVFGERNDTLPNLIELTAEEFAQSSFFTYCISKVETRTIDPSQIDQSKLKLPVKVFDHWTLFFMNTGEGYAIKNEFWEGKIRYFKFALCHHQWVEKGTDWCREHKVFHGGNCYHVYECSKCGAVTSTDSSD